MSEDRQHYNVTFALLAIVGISFSLLQSPVAPALPDIQHALGTTENHVSWVLTSYLLSASVATPLVGRLGDMYGKEKLMMIVLVLLSVGTVVSALSTTLAVMLVGRVVQGAAGGVFPLAFGIIRDEFPRARVAGGIGLMSALLGVGGGVLKVPVLNAWCGIPLRAAAATSAFMIGVTATAGAIIYYGNGQLVPALVAAAVLGVQAGSRLGLRIGERTSNKALKLVMATVMIVVAVIMAVRGRA